MAALQRTPGSDLAGRQPAAEQATMYGEGKRKTATPPVCDDKPAPAATSQRQAVQRSAGCSLITAAVLCRALSGRARKITHLSRGCRLAEERVRALPSSMGDGKSAPQARPDTKRHSSLASGRAVHASGHHEFQRGRRLQSVAQSHFATASASPKRTMASRRSTRASAASAAVRPPRT